MKLFPRIDACTELKDLLPRDELRPNGVERKGYRDVNTEVLIIRSVCHNGVHRGKPGEQDGNETKDMLFHL